MQLCSGAVVDVEKARTKRPRSTAEWQTIHDAADRMMPTVRRAFLDAVIGSSKKAGTLAAIENAVRTGSVTQVLSALQLDAVRDDLGFRLSSGDFTSALTTTYQTAGSAVLPAVIAAAGRRGSVDLGMRFDLTSPRSIDFLRSYQGSLVREVTNEQATSMISVVRNAFEEGGHPYSQARRIRAQENFGLTTRQNQAVSNFRRSMQEAGTSGPKLDKAVDRYRRKVLRYRSENIARTETIRAAEYGHQESMKQAADAGLYDAGGARRKWVVTPDDRLCDLCRAVPGLNPDGVGIDVEFATPLGPRTNPPLHPHCRCSQVLTFSEDD